MRKLERSPLRVTDGDLLASLQVVAPALWDPLRPVPLAVGIHAQIYPIMDPRGISRRSVRRFLTRWTSSIGYLCALSRPGVSRFNLDGSRAEPVAESHQERARRRLDKREHSITDCAPLRRASDG